MSGEHNILYDSSRILLCINGCDSYHKSSIFEIILNPLLYKGEDFLLCLRIRLQKMRLKFRWRS
jgi:hypothetical protein